MDTRLLFIAVVYFVVAAAFIARIEEAKLRMIHAVAHCAIAVVYIMLAFGGHA